ncbi:MAG: DUF2905 family protein [Bacteroidetes bacterium]|nr:MAG: DUF2905 family protein [Bacteroidota bacterium]
MFKQGLFFSFLRLSGRLFYIERPSVRVYVPIASMLLLSLLLSALLYLVRRFWP